MGRIFHLIYNEVAKIFLQKSTWIMYLALIIITIAALFMYKHNLPEEEYSDDWKTELTEQVEEFENHMESDDGQNDNMGVFAQAEYEKNKYHIEHDIKPRDTDALLILNEMADISSLISLFVVIIAGGIVANEFRFGTIKQLLIRPISRGTILLSKFIATIIFALVTLLLMFAIILIFGSFLFGMESWTLEYVINSNDGITSEPMIKVVLMTYLYKFINLIMMTSFAFMISTIFRNSALAIGLALFFMFMGSTIVGLLSRYYDWAKFILFANTDLSMYNSDFGPPVEGMTMQFSIIMLIIYFVVFMFLSFFIFSKRDVAGQ